MVSGAKAVCPPKRLGHSLKMIGSKMYLFGGLDENVAFNDIWVFDTGKMCRLSIFSSV